jgi:hypothetical protein
MEREKECICIVGHQAILRALLGYFTATPPEKVGGGWGGGRGRVGRGLPALGRR